MLQSKEQGTPTNTSSLTCSSDAIYSLSASISLAREISNESLGAATVIPGKASSQSSSTLNNVARPFSSTSTLFRKRSMIGVVPNTELNNMQMRVKQKWVLLLRFAHNDFPNGHASARCASAQATTHHPLSLLQYGLFHKIASYADFGDERCYIDGTRVVRRILFLKVVRS